MDRDDRSLCSHLDTTTTSNCRRPYDKSKETLQLDTYVSFGGIEQF